MKLERQKFVLIAEDDRSNQILAVERLKRLGFKSVVVSDGQAAVDAVMQRREEIALILMDLSMPVMDGMSATRLIRTGEASQNHIPIIAVTANGEREACLSAGMDDFVTKPYSNFDLLCVLGRWVALPSAPTTGVSFIR